MPPGARHCSIRRPIRLTTFTILPPAWPPVSAGWPNWSLPFIEWAEREGYAIDVVTNADLEEHPDLLGPGTPYSLYLSIGHDEYWSGPMRDTVEAFIAAGGRVVAPDFFGFGRSDNGLHHQFGSVLTDLDAWDGP